MKLKTLSGVLAILSGLTALSARADDFYRGTKIQLIVGTDVGGSYDLSARLIARFLPKYIDGSPALVVQNIPGAGSVVAANMIYNVAPQDGSVIGAFVQTLPLSQLFGDAQTRFDVGRFQWIGNPTSSPNVIVALKMTGVVTIDDARKKEISIGVTSRASSGGMEVALANNLLGTQFKPVMGYKGGREIDLAIERHEVLGRAGQSWEGWKQTRPDWIKNGAINVLVQIGPRKAKDLPDTPLITELSNEAQAKQVLSLYSATIALGRPLAMGPGVPAERVQQVRAAFRQTMTDPAFLQDAIAVGYEIDPIEGDELQKIVSSLSGVPPDLVELARRAFGLQPQ
jgi:tripartite-type tricarboxylate transporter receptor subunit TctC